MVITLLCCASYIYPQQIKSKPIKKKKISVSKEKKGEPILSEQSVVQVSDLNIIARGKDGNLFVGGYNTEFEENKVNAYSLLWKISGDRVSVKKLSFLGQIGEMFFLDDFTGWISGPGSGVYKTTDGGENWEKLANSDDIRGSIFFLDNDTGWYFGKDEYLKRIRKGNVEKLKLFENFPYVKKLQFTSFEQGWLIDVLNSKNRFRYTEDGGLTWKQITIDNSSADNFQFIGNAEGFAIAEKGLYYTNDNGKSWELIKEQTKNEWFNNLFFIDRNTGWTIGQNICSTKNGGTDWKCSELKKEVKDKTIYGFVFTDVDVGWLLSDKGLYTTMNGGNTWQRKLLSFNEVEF